MDEYNPEWITISKTELYNEYQHLMEVDKAETGFTDYPSFEEWLNQRLN